MFQVLQADLLKVKRKGLWFLVVLGPVGVIALQIVNYGIRYEYLMKLFPNVWEGLLHQVNLFLPTALLLGIAILTSMVATIEHQQNGWKQLISLPIPRWTVFSSKFLIVSTMLVVSCFLTFVGTVGLGIGLGFENIPYGAIIKNSFYPLFAGLPVIAVQLWLSIVCKNQSIPLSVGIFASIFSMYAHNLPNWVFWLWPYLVGYANQTVYVYIGIALGLGILIMGIVDFNRRDVH
ncbi:ABC transporter permease [Bacillus sp. CGMCC 1.16541]|uniref:ABC transporter permease n=1 Tax=Bacillus sp. CGMCC 1.16541 TaxID=2185143 RepID=UPI000D73A5B8|nr:ABC transporter permease [Bacillus sp. CGMCC 1.16541]